MGDGEINEGSVWEAAMCAGKHALARACRRTWRPPTRCLHLSRRRPSPQIRAYRCFDARYLSGLRMAPEKAVAPAEGAQFLGGKISEIRQHRILGETAMALRK